VSTTAVSLSGLRPVRDADAQALTALIAAAYAEYPGCVMDLPGIDADLLAPETAAAERGGRWWVLEVEGRIIASVGTGPVRDDGHLELKRLYLDRPARGQGLATTLIDRVEAHAAGLGAVAVDLWSDSRFANAHHRYQQIGYLDTGEDRHLGDPSDTTEHRFVKPLVPSTPRREVTWDGPHGRDRCALVDLPDGALLRGAVGEIGYEVEVDDAWRARRSELTPSTGSVRLTSDGAGRWWRDGAPADDLAGCLDVDIEVTPATNALPIRRLALAIGEAAEVTAAWIRVPAATTEPLVQRYERTGTHTWRYTAGAFDATLEVDDVGLPVSYVHPPEGRLWTRVH
jgi:GNAT superfamily N-acetyltransferase